MSYAFKKIGATNILENAPDNANVVCEVNGEVNRVPATSIGGGGGIKVAIVKQTGSTYSCDNMTYQEAVEYLTNGAPFLIYIFYGTRYKIVATAEYSSNDRIDFADIDDMEKTIVFHWTSTGISAGRES